MVSLGLRMQLITGFKILKFLSDPKASVFTLSVVYVSLCDYDKVMFACDLFCSISGSYIWCIDSSRLGRSQKKHILLRYGPTFLVTK